VAEKATLVPSGDQLTPRASGRAVVTYRIGESGSRVRTARAGGARAARAARADGACGRRGARGRASRPFRAPARRESGHPRGHPSGRVARGPPPAARGRRRARTMRADRAMRAYRSPSVLPPLDDGSFSVRPPSAFVRHFGRPARAASRVGAGLVRLYLLRAARRGQDDSRRTQRRAGVRDVCRRPDVDLEQSGPARTPEAPNRTAPPAPRAGRSRPAPPPPRPRSTAAAGRRRATPARLSAARDLSASRWRRLP
jgi:hypothetical protein